MQGATHSRVDSGEPVKATQWNKDGDHAGVVRYPVERREFKGLLVVGPKEKHALRFGDWIVEDAEGNAVHVVDAAKFASSFEAVDDPAEKPAEEASA